MGSLVRIRVEGCPEARGLEAISKAFAVATDVHRLMSFHDPASDLSRLNRSAHCGALRVDARTMTVLVEAVRVARASGGAFDPTVAPAAVKAGALPQPEGAPEPDPRASWRDVELDPDKSSVRFRRPLWLDLGGIAKGYAVDVATTILRRQGVTQGCVEAGGDLRVFGARPEAVALDPGWSVRRAARAVRLHNRSLASSGELGAAEERLPERSAHFDAARRRRAPERFVSVMADRCVLADALTKVVLARGRGASVLLRRFGATAAICSPALRWSVCGASPP